MFSKGLSSLGSLAGSAAHAAKERAAQAHLDQAAAQAAEKAKEVGTKGWSLLKSAYATAAGAVEQAAAQVGRPAAACCVCVSRDGRWGRSRAGHARARKDRAC